MKQAIHKRLYHWHSKIGVSIALLMLALCLTAIPAIYLDDIANWLVPKSADRTHALTLDQWVDRGAQTLPLYEQEFHLELNHDTPIFWLKQNDVHTAFVEQDNGLFAPHSGAAAVRTLAHAHYDFLLPRPYGEYVVGLVGLAALTIMLMGIFLHRKWRSEATVLRQRRSRRLWLSDLHKVLGLWLLPFHLIMTYTGAVLGLGGLLLIVAAYSAFDGDKQAAIEAIIGKAPVLTQQTCTPQSLDTLAAKNREHWANLYGDSVLLEVEVEGLGDCQGVATFASEIPGYLLLENAVTFSLTTGEIQKVVDWVPASFGERWYAFIGPLHFGNFAGYMSKALYAMSALLLALLCVSGLLVWLSKRHPELQRKESFVDTLHDQMTVSWVRALFSLISAIALGTATVLMSAKFLPLFNWPFSNGYNPAVFTWIYALSFSSLFLLAWWRAAALPWSLALNCFLFIFTPIASWIVYGISLDHLALELTLLAVGVLSGYCITLFNRATSSEAHRVSAYGTNRNLENDSATDQAAENSDASNAA